MQVLAREDFAFDLAADHEVVGYNFAADVPVRADRDVALNFESSVDFAIDLDPSGDPNRSLDYRSSADYRRLGGLAPEHDHLPGDCCVAIIVQHYCFLRKAFSYRRPSFEPAGVKQLTC